MAFRAMDDSGGMRVLKEMLRYLENSEELKVGVTELQEHLEGTCTNRYYVAASGSAGEE